MVSSISAETFGLLGVYLPWLLSGIVLVHLSRTYVRLRHIPGPFGASFSNLARLSWVWSRRAHEKHIELHRQYGPLVRFGPNMVSVADPKEVPNIYGFSGKYKKVRSIASPPGMLQSN